MILHSCFSKKSTWLIGLLLLSLKTFSQFSIDAEIGAFQVNRNDASSSWKNSSGELNGLNGTLFSYAKDFNNPVKPLARLRCSYSFGKQHKHFISILAAPLSYTTVGTFNKDVVFNSTLFQSHKQTTGYYKFSGYRLTYRYYIIQKERLKLGIGLTLNLRDAEFSLKQDDKYERNYNRGFVPLVNTFLSYKFSERFGMLIDGDVFYIDNTGGAIDYLTAGTFTINKKIYLKAGYRFFSGVGSEVGNVYNKLFVSSYVLGAFIQF